MVFYDNILNKLCVVTYVDPYDDSAFIDFDGSPGWMGMAYLKDCEFVGWL